MSIVGPIRAPREMLESSELSNKTDFLDAFMLVT